MATLVKMSQAHATEIHISKALNAAEYKSVTRRLTKLSPPSKQRAFSCSNQHASASPSNRAFTTSSNRASTSSGRPSSASPTLRASYVGDCTLVKLVDPSHKYHTFITSPRARKNRFRLQVQAQPKPAQIPFRQHDLPSLPAVSPSSPLHDSDEMDIDSPSVEELQAAKIASMEGEIGTLRAENTMQKAEITTLKAEKTAQQAEISALKAENAISKAAGATPSTTSTLVKTKSMSDLGDLFNDVVLADRGNMARNTMYAFHTTCGATRKIVNENGPMKEEDLVDKLKESFYFEEIQSIGYQRHNRQYSEFLKECIRWGCKVENGMVSLRDTPLTAMWDMWNDIRPNGTPEFRDDGQPYLGWKYSSKVSAQDQQAFMDLFNFCAVTVKRPDGKKYICRQFSSLPSGFLPVPQAIALDSAPQTAPTPGASASSPTRAPQIATTPTFIRSTTPQCISASASDVFKILAGTPAGSSAPAVPVPAAPKTPATPLPSAPTTNPPATTAVTPAAQLPSEQLVWSCVRYTLRSLPSSVPTDGSFIDARSTVLGAVPLLSEDPNSEEKNNQARAMAQTLLKVSCILKKTATGVNIRRRGSPLISLEDVFRGIPVQSFTKPQWTDHFGTIGRVNGFSDDDKEAFKRITRYLYVITGEGDNSIMRRALEFKQ